MGTHSTSSLVVTDTKATTNNSTSIYKSRNEWKLAWTKCLFSASETTRSRLLCTSYYPGTKRNEFWLSSTSSSMTVLSHTCFWIGCLVYHALIPYYCHKIAGAYPGLTKDEFLAVTSEPAGEVGQWTYDFSDPNGPQLGTVAVEGSFVVHACADPVVIIAEHPSLGVSLPKTIENAVDLLVVVDRALTTFAERKFLVVQVPGEPEILIRAYPSKTDMPDGVTILGQVELVQIPWLPSMKPTKSGFMEVDEYF